MTYQEGSINNRIRKFFWDRYGKQYTSERVAEYLGLEKRTVQWALAGIVKDKKTGIVRVKMGVYSYMGNRDSVGDNYVEGNHLEDNHLGDNVENISGSVEGTSRETPRNVVHLETRETMVVVTKLPKDDRILLQDSIGDLFIASRISI